MSPNRHKTRRRAAALVLALAVAAVLFAPSAQALPETDLMISQIYFDVPGNDNRRQWVQLYNDGPTDITLTGSYSLGFGRNDYTRTVVDLVGTIASGQVFVVGGDISDALNYDPVFDQSIDFAPNIRVGNNNTRADGVALFTGPASAIAVGSDPLHTVIYGEATAGTRPWLTDESGAVNSGSLDVVLPTSGIAGQSLAFDGTSWSVQVTPTPLASNVPQPGSGVLLATGLIGLAWLRQRRTLTPALG